MFAALARAGEGTILATERHVPFAMCIREKPDAHAGDLVTPVEIDADEARSGTATRLLEYLPVALFGSVMGLTGLSVAWRLAAARYDVPSWAADAVAILAVVAFVAMTIAYAVKCHWRWCCAWWQIRCAIPPAITSGRSSSPRRRRSQLQSSFQQQHLACS